MKYIVAVSGGVDSVVLLDMLVNVSESLTTAKPSWHARESWSVQESLDAPAQGVNGLPVINDPAGQLIIAHFDHGIRPESDADARFVWAVAQRYGLPFEVRREELGKDASEALARERRYAFLKDMAEKYGAKIVTAHHADDLVETIALNLQRGTGWRGLAVFGDRAVMRPLIGTTKRELYDYATEHSLEWVEDETNQSDTYARNRIRQRLGRLGAKSRRQLLELHQTQVDLRDQIAGEIDSYAKSNSRYFFTMIPDLVALELLREKTTGQLTRPQLRSVLLAIKTAQPGTTHESGAGISVRFSRREFIVENTSRVL